MVPRFLANRAADVGKIRAALAGADFEAVRVAAHGILKRKPDLVNGSRRARIAAGSGTTVSTMAPSSVSQSVTGLMRVRLIPGSLS